MKKNIVNSEKSIIKLGRNAWLRSEATEAGLVIDGRCYYRAFYKAALQARQHILIAGWRFNSDVRLLRGEDVAKGEDEVRFLPFLDQVCKRNPELRVYILAWNYSMIFYLQWERFQEWVFDGAGDGRIHFCYDNHHPFGASHHQKFVVVDNQVAFVGGLDFNADDWDDRRHLADNSERAEPGREPHGPYHDAQAYLAGPVAGELAEYFAKRWEDVTTEELVLKPPPSSDCTIRPCISLPPGPVVVSRTEPFSLDHPCKITEIRQLYLDAINAADELIYLENQYFSSQAFFQALENRMRASGRPLLDIVIILPQQVPSWLEAAVHSPAKLRMLETLKETARQTGHRLGFYCTVACYADGKEVPVTIHTKILIVDDLFLTVGSANTSNRSMGLDTELNVAWEATSTDLELIEAIRHTRTNLLAEHCGWPKSKKTLSQLNRREVLVPALDGLAATNRLPLRILTPDIVYKDRAWLEYLATWGVNLDPGRPLVDETLYEML